MPTETGTDAIDPEIDRRTSESGPDGAPALRTWDRRAFRLGIGVSICFLLALYFDWTLAYLAPVFASPMLQSSTAVICCGRHA